MDRLVARGDSGRVAVDGATTVTYAELDAAANRLGRLLQRRDIEPGDRVALLFRDPAAAYPALLATLKAQAGYVPSTPASRRTGSTTSSPTPGSAWC